MGAILVSLSRNPAVYLFLGILMAAYAAFAALGLSPNFDQRAMGISVLHGQDASLRTLLHVLLVLSGTCLLLALFLKLKLGLAAAERVQVPPRYALILATALAANLVFYQLRDLPLFLHAAYALAYLMVLGFVLARRERVLPLGDFRWILVVLCYQVLLSGYAVLGEQPRFNVMFFALLSVLLLLVLAVCDVLVNRRVATVAVLEHSEATEFSRLSVIAPSLIRFAHAAWPFALLPMGIIFANEIQYTLSVRFAWAASSSVIWLVLLAMLFAVSLLLYLRPAPEWLGDDHSGNSMLVFRRLLISRYLPALLLSTVAFAEYEGFVKFYAFHDLFHGGESLVPVQQLLQFGAIPYIDFYPPHGLFDMLPQLFYQLLNGTSYPESIIWGQGYILGWLPRMLAVLLMYWLFARFLDYRSAFVLLFFLPTYHLLHPYYVVLVLPLLALNGSEKGIGRWLLFWSLILFLYLWRIDFGLATTAAASFMLLARFWSEPEWPVIRSALGAFALVFGGAAVLFVLLCQVRGESPLYVVSQALAYIQVQNQAAALERIIRGVDFAAVLQYLLLPLVGVLYVAYFSAGVLGGKKFSHLHGLVAFLAVVSLVLSSRSLNRHSHFEGVFNPYFFVLIIGVAAVFFLRRSRTLQAVSLVIVCAGSYAFLPKSTSLFTAFFYDRHVQQEYAGPATARQQPVLSPGPAPQTRVDASFIHVDNIVFFLRSFLQGDETFYDFTNSPLLYAPAQKRAPVFILETLYHTSEPIQADVLRRLSERIDAGELPITLFKQGNLWDYPDTVPNELRSYRIVEFIYRHFRPCANVDNYEVWLNRSLYPAGDCLAYLQKAWPQYAQMPDSTRPGLQPVARTNQQFEMRQLAYIWANHDVAMSGEAMQRDATIASVTPVAEGYRIAVPPQLDKRQGTYVHLRIQSAQDTVATLTYGGGNSLAFDVKAATAPQSYLIRISGQYAWNSEEIDSLLLSSSAPIALSELSFVPGD